MEEKSEFWKQFAGSGVANIFTVLAVAVLVCVRKLCEREKKCKSHIHCCCLDLDVRDETLRNGPGSSARGPGAVL